MALEGTRWGSHTITRLTVHIVWVTQYRYHVLKGEVQKRCRALLIQICDAEDVISSIRLPSQLAIW